MTKCRSKVTRNRGVLVMPTSVINPRVVLIVRLICHDEKVYEEKVTSMLPEIAPKTQPSMKKSI